MHHNLGIQVGKIVTPYIDWKLIECVLWDVLHHNICPIWATHQTYAS